MSRRPPAVLAAAVLAGCGLKSSLVAPELVRPLPPAAVTAASTAEGVRLAWRRPERYSGGGRMRDLGGFEVERRAGAPGAPFEPIGTLRLADQRRFRPTRDLEWIDRAVVSGGRYVYRVIAFTTGGDHGEPSRTVAITYTAPPPAAAPRAP